MKNGQKLKLGYAHVTPRNIQEVQASKLGDAHASPLHQQKYQVKPQCAIFLLLHILCVILGASLFQFSFVFSLFCFACCNKKLGPSILVWERDMLHFNCIEHSSFHFYCSTSVLFCQYCVQLWFFTLIMLRACLVFFTYV